MTRKRCFRPSRGLMLSVLVFVFVSTASAEWKEKVLYSFQGGTDGSLPAGGVIFDKAGNLYGLTIYGGSTACPPGWCGTFYQLSPPPQKGGTWTEKVLYVFKGHNQSDGSSPSGGLIADDERNFYGVTGYGGSGPCVLFGTATGCGTVFELTPPKTKGGTWIEKVLYNFQGGSDGDLPTGPLVFDSTGNLYGATEFGGGKGTTCDLFYGGNCGTVFKLSPPKTKGGKWTEKVLHRFAGIASGKYYGDGAVPNGGLALDGTTGTIYGTTYIGGYNCPHNSNQGCGTAFELKPPTKTGGAWTQKVIHVFKAGNDGGEPNGSLIFDNTGSLYGTAGGGPSGDAGIVFRFVRNKFGVWQKAVLYGFNSNGQHGTDPLAGLILDAEGNLYSTTYSANLVSGTVFRLSPSRPVAQGAWSLSLLYGFKGSPDGAQPAADLGFDKAGMLYSTTQKGGTGTACEFGCGTVFEVSPK
jgi:hypothetical protein